VQSDAERTIMKRTILALITAVVLGFPLGGIVAMLLTPVFWRLESVLHVELAGHSGPSYWLILVIMAVTASVIFFLFRRALSSPRG
jgi:ABC-type antimicrobial peptide transport system permease subunit